MELFIKIFQNINTRRKAFPHYFLKEDMNLLNSMSMFSHALIIYVSLSI